MKIRLLTDDEHSALGAELSGMEARLSIDASPEDHRAMWKEAISDPSIAVLILSRTVYEDLIDWAQDHQRSGKAPLLIQLPDYGEFFESDEEAENG